MAARSSAKGRHMQKKETVSQEVMVMDWIVGDRCGYWDAKAWELSCRTWVYHGLWFERGLTGRDNRG